MKPRKKLGLALGSGGTRGLAHVGVIKVLVKNNIPIDYIAGSSIGAWVGAHYALYNNVEELEFLTDGKKREKLFTFFEPSFSGGLVKGDKLEKLLEEWLGKSSFADLKIPLQIVTTDLIKGEKFVIKKGLLAPAVHASMSIPGLFNPVKYENKILVDGGVVDPVPDEVVKKMGADVVLAVCLDKFPKMIFDENKELNLRNVLNRSMEIMSFYLSSYSIKMADIVVHPELTKYSSWGEYFLKDTSKEIIKIGEREMEKMLPRLIKLLDQ